MSPPTPRGEFSKYSLIGTLRHFNHLITNNLPDNDVTKILIEVVLQHRMIHVHEDFGNKDNFAIGDICFRDACANFSVIHRSTKIAYMIEVDIETDDLRLVGEKPLQKVLIY